MISKKIEDIILQEDFRGMKHLSEFMNENYVSNASDLLLKSEGEILIVTGFYILKAKSPETDGPPGAMAISNALNKIGLNYIPSIANFITIIFKNRDDVINCSNYLLANGIIIRDLIGFGLPDGIRVTIGTNEENLYFIQKLKKYINN